MLTYIVLFFGLGVTFSQSNQFLAFTVASITSLVSMTGVSLVTEDSVEEQQIIAFGQSDRNAPTAPGDD
jgi:hypothetical protein